MSGTTANGGDLFANGMPESFRVPVAITGIGASTPLGGNVQSSWEALLDGKTGVGAIAGWADDLPTRIGAGLAVDPALEIDPAIARRMDRVQQLAFVAANEAWADAGKPAVEPERLAVVVGSGSGGMATLQEQLAVMERSGLRGVSPASVSMFITNGSAAMVAMLFNAKAGTHCPVSACATGSEALALGMDLIRLGRADVVIAGGTEAGLNRVALGSFMAARALSRRNDEPQRASRPFDIDRDGFVMGEGAGILVLERESHAVARGARIHGRLAGGSITSDAMHPVAPDPEGRGAARAVTLALRDAGLGSADVSHVNAHATSTQAGDVAEAAGLRLAFGADLDNIPITGTKSSTGHMIGAAGAVEGIFAVLSAKNRTAPPTLNLDNQDPKIDLDVATEPRALRAGGAIVSTAFGFGGHNAALVFTE